MMEVRSVLERYPQETQVKDCKDCKMLLASQIAEFFKISQKRSG